MNYIISMRGREIEIEKLSKMEIGYILGIFVGDGYIYHDKKNRHYSIEFYLNSEKDSDIIKFLFSILIKIGAKPYIYKDKRFNSIRIRVRSKKLYNFLIQLNKNKPSSNEFKVGFISGFIDAEGYVNSAKSIISIVNTNKKVLKTIKKYLEDLKIKSNINERKKSIKDRLPSYRLYIPVKFIKIRNNSLKIQRYKMSSRQRGRSFQAP